MINMTMNEPMPMTEARLHDNVFGLVREYLPKGGRVIDLGAGQGAFSRRLKESGYDVLAIDGDKSNWKAPEIPYEERNLDSEFAGELSEKERFDAVIAIEIIEHIENPFSFIRECSKLLKPGGLLFLTTPNVEAANSRIMFLFKGRLHGFDANATMRLAHITPLFKWKLDMALDEANFSMIRDTHSENIYHLGSGLKGTLAGIAARLITPFVIGNKKGSNWILVGKAK